MWNRIHARRLDRSHGDAVRALIGSVALLELAPLVLARALEPFPVPVRTLDALHLASIEFLRQRQQQLELASYDERLIAGARASYFAVWCRNHSAGINHGVAAMISNVSGAPVVRLQSTIGAERLAERVAMAAGAVTDPRRPVPSSTLARTASGERYRQRAFALTGGDGGEFGIKVRARRGPDGETWR